MNEPSGPTVLPLAKIRPGDNPRRYFDPKKHADLVASFRQRGVLQPILLRPVSDADGIFAVVAGGRRYRAALEAFGPDGEVPVIVREMSDQEALEAAIDENDNRADASETEQADAAVRVLAACDGDHAEAARRLAWSRSKLDRRLALAGLSDAVKRALDERRIKVGHAELLAAVPNDKQDTALETILSADLDVARTRELLMRVTQSLAAAIFDKTECATCPFNSVRQCALFETHVDDGHCTNPGCFQLKTESAEQARAEATPAATPHSGAAGGENTPAAMPGEARPSTPDSSPGSSPDQGSAPSAAKPGDAGRRAPAPPKVTVASIAARVADMREAAWRAAVVGALTGDGFVSDLALLRRILADAITGGLTFSRVAEMVPALEVDLRASWQVDRAFLARLNKDELKFVAQECGLVAHMGERAFAQLLKSKPEKLVTGMLDAPGFAWAGRLPGAMTLDGEYGPPPADAAPANPTPEAAQALAEKD